MAKHTLNCVGMRCPQPVLKMALAARKLPRGALLVVMADCPSFPGDIKKWCDKHRKALLQCAPAGGSKYIAQVQL